jgi:hypothetical protein
MKILIINLIYILAVLLVACQETIDPVDTLTFNAGTQVIRLNPVDVAKQNPMPVYMHYMPWFETPNDTTPNWGYHWTMINSDPTQMDPATGQRDIAAHFYPLIGPYHSSDPDVIRYHLLLMKYSGIDGILIDWYGVEGTNGDIEMLLQNSNKLISHLDEIGLDFAIVLEDRFSADASDVVANLQYMEEYYYSNVRYIKSNNSPLVLIFGPIGITDSGEWEDILASTNARESFVPLWNNNLAGGVASGSYVWPSGVQDLTDISNYYAQSNVDDVIGGIAYPGFKDYYLEGLGEDIIGWEIPVSPQTFDDILNVSLDNFTTIDFLQVATWNDFGEGTIVEPTVENGYTFLEQLQDFTYISRFGKGELELIYDWYLFTKDTTLDDNQEIQNHIEQMFYYLTALDVDAARAENVKIQDLK